MLKEILDFLLQIHLKLNYRNKIPVLFFLAGISVLTQNWWEPLIYGILNKQYDIPVDPNPDYLTSGILFGLGMIIFLFNRYDENKKQAKPSLPSAQLNPKRAAFNKLRIGTTDEIVGRHEALHWLEKQLIEKHSNQVAVASVFGSGGIGKTYLANVFAERHKETALILEMYAGQRKPLDIGIEFLTKVGGDSTKMSSFKKVKIALEAFFSNGDGILIVDDVWNEDIEQVLPQTTNWRVLITTRDKSLGKKLTNKTYLLDVLTTEQSLELFKKVLGDKYKGHLKTEYEQLSDYLGNRPYGIRLAAESLKESLRHHTPQDLLNQLRERGFEVPREGFGEDAQGVRQLRVLLEHCLSQLESQSSYARELLNALAACANEGMEMRYFLHWHSHTSSEEQIEHELTLIQNLNLLFIEEQNFSLFGHTHNIVRIRLHTDLLNLLREASLEKERQSLQAFLHQTLVLSGQSIESHRSLQFQVNSLIAGLTEDSPNTELLYDQFFAHLYRTGRLQWAYELGAVFLKEQEKDGDKAGLHVAYGNQAMILKAWGQLDEAMRLHQKEERLCEQLGDQAGLSRSYGNQAVILRAWGKLEEAMSLHQKQERLCEQLGDQAGLSKSYSGQGLILKAWGKLDEAMEFYRKEETLCQELGDQAGLSRSYGNQALILQAWGKLDEAMRLHQKQERLCEQLGDQAGLSRSYGNQAVILSAWGKLDEAMRLHQKQERLCEQLGDQAGLSRTYGNQAVILKAWGQLDKAMRLHQKQERLKEQLGDQAGLSISYGNQALILKAWGKLDEAMRLHQKEERLCEQLGDKAGLIACYWNMGLLYQQMEDHSTAIEKFEQAIELEKLLKHPDLEDDQKFLENYRQEKRGTDLFL